MISGIVGLLTILLTALAPILAGAAKRKEAREARTNANDNQTMDKALAARDADTVSRLFDELRESEIPGGDNPGGQGSDPAAGRQLPGNPGVAP